MVLTAEQKEFFAEHGYLRYGRVLSDDELAALRQRSADIVEGRLEHMPARYIQRSGSSGAMTTPMTCRCSTGPAR